MLCLGWLTNDVAVLCMGRLINNVAGQETGSIGGDYHPPNPPPARGRGVDDSRKTNRLHIQSDVVTVTVTTDSEV